MKSIIFIFALLLIFSCSQKNKNSISKKDSTVVAIDSVAVNIDSSKIENLKQESIPDEEPKDGKYSQIIKDKDISAEIFYTIKEGRVDYYKLKVYQHKKIQNLDAVSDWEFKNVEELDFKFDSLKSTITKPLTPAQFYFKLQPVVAKIREGHLSLRIPAKRFSKKEIKELKNTKGLFGRFEYHVEDDHLYFTENKDSVANIKPGTELLSINDVPVSTYLKKYRELISSDGYNTTFYPYYLKDVFFSFLVAEKGVMDSAKIETLFQKTYS